ncbi:hypothetical protein RZE82_08360 [Mollicutes bacterium LVI A0039]|nr:hypothetical protein RZE82_08360 [Mollicutes bacterium LVI A0039]
MEEKKPNNLYKSLSLFIFVCIGVIVGVKTILLFTVGTNLVISEAIIVGVLFIVALLLRIKG